MQSIQGPSATLHITKYSVGKQNRKITEGCSRCIFQKINDKFVKKWSQQVEYMQVPNGAGSGVCRSKRPMSACHIHRKMLYGNLSVKGRVRL